MEIGVGDHQPAMKQVISPQRQIYPVEEIPSEDDEYEEGEYTPEADWVSREEPAERSGPKEEYQVKQQSQSYNKPKARANPPPTNSRNKQSKQQMSWVRTSTGGPST